MAPHAGLEPATKWLIPPAAGLYQLSVLFEKPSDASFLHLLLPRHRPSPGTMFFFPYKLPGTSKSFGGLAAPVAGIVVLANTTLHIIRGPTVISPGRFTLKYVYPKGHNQKPRLEARLPTLPGPDSTN